MNESNFSPINQESSESLYSKINMKKALSMIPEQYQPYVQEALQQYPNVPPEALITNLRAESNMKDPYVVSSDGGMGFAQAMPGTWKQYKAKGSPFNPRDSILFAAKVLNDIHSVVGDDLVGLRVGYNAGKGNAMKYVNRGRDLSMLKNKILHNNMASYAKQIESLGGNLETSIIGTGIQPNNSTDNTKTANLSDATQALLSASNSTKQPNTEQQEYKTRKKTKIQDYSEFETKPEEQSFLGSILPNMKNLLPKF